MVEDETFINGDSCGASMANFSNKASESKIFYIVAPTLKRERTELFITKTD